MRRVSISSELIMCGVGVRSILLLFLVDRSLKTIDVCIWRMRKATASSWYRPICGYLR